MVKGIVRRMASRDASRRFLNALYVRLSPRQKALCHRHFAKIFRQAPGNAESGIWFVDFAGERIFLPLAGERMWLDWDSALSILGHDVEIKTIYEALVGSERPPQVFFDIGANYGLHSVLLLVHGVRVVSFEPNPACHERFRAVCALNGVSCDIRPVALGARDGWCELWFPPSDTWEGTTDAGMREHLSAREPIMVTAVEQRTLDGFVRESGLAPDLVKMDTEGTEADVLRGALHTLKSRHPTVIFESWTSSRRGELFDLLQQAGYAISTLPFQGGNVLDYPAFLHSPACNFMASAQA